MRRFGVLVIVTGVAAVAAASGVAAPHYIVHGSVDARGRIALKNGVGEPYTAGRAGMYVITVADTSRRDGFRLVGPGVSVAITGVRYVGVRTVGVTLRPGTYVYRSDAHPRTVRGSFRIRR